MFLNKTALLFNCHPTQLSPCWIETHTNKWLCIPFSPMTWGKKRLHSPSTSSSTPVSSTNGISPCYSGIERKPAFSIHSRRLSVRCSTPLSGGHTPISTKAVGKRAHPWLSQTAATDWLTFDPLPLCSQLPCLLMCPSGWAKGLPTFNTGNLSQDISK